MKNLNFYLILIVLLVYSCQKNEETITSTNLNQTLSTRADDCSTDGLIEKTFTDCGLTRKFYIQLPSGFNEDSTYPLLFAFHGRGSGMSNKACAWKDRIGDWIDEHKFIAVYGRAVGDSSWYIEDACLSYIDELCYINTIKTKMEYFYNINPQRIYAMGSSNGGALCMYAASNVDWLAAITCLAAYPWESYELSEVPSLPLFQIHGSLDGTIPYEGGTLECLEFDNCYSRCSLWAIHNNCLASPVNTSFTISGNTVNKSNWCNPKIGLIPTCKKCARKEVLHYKLMGIGHTIYSQIAGIPGYKERINDDIFAFFLRHKL